MGGMEGIKGERNEQQSDRAENHEQHGLYLCRFEVEKVKFLIKNTCCLYLRNIMKHHETKLSESEKWSRKTLDGKCDGYMWGLGGATKQKC